MNFTANDVKAGVVYRAKFSDRLWRWDVKEELPATIFDEKQLREVVKFIANNLHMMK